MAGAGAEGTHPSVALGKNRAPTFAEGCIMQPMTKACPTAAEKIVRDSRSGRFEGARGRRAEGRLTIKKGLDLTKPIASRPLKGSGRSCAAFGHQA